MVLLGATPPGRIIEQHDIFFGIGESLKKLLPAMQMHWPEAEGGIHIDAWQEVAFADNYRVEIKARQDVVNGDMRLFFINLGGYRSGDFEEYHYKMVVVAPDKNTAMKQAKDTAFFKHTGFPGGGEAHIDDKYGIDIDDAYAIEDILATPFKEKYRINLVPVDVPGKNDLNIGYVRINKL